MPVVPSGITFQQVRKGIRRVAAYTREQKDTVNENNKNPLNFAITHMMNGIKQRCKKTGKHYDIDREHVEKMLKAGVCEATGIKFRYEKNGRGSITPFSPSVDCIDPEEGYTFSNTQFVCSMYNIGKARHSETDFIAMCIAVAQRNKDNLVAHERLRELME